METVGVINKFPEINSLLKKAVQQIARQLNPLKIILFGSYAYGNPSSDSDIDLLVIIDHSNEPRYKREAGVNRLLTDLHFPRDILVYTQAEVEEWSEVPLAFITTIIRKGKVIYEKK